MGRLEVEPFLSRESSVYASVTLGKLFKTFYVSVTFR